MQVAPILPPLSGSLDDDRYEFRYVPPAELRGVWPELQYGLEVVRTTNGEPWIPADVYAALLHNRAALYVVRKPEDGELVGFGIFEPINFPCDFQTRLNIWIGWAKHPAHGDIGVELARRIAREAGLQSIVFCTPQTNKWVQRFKRLFTWYEV